MAIPSHAASTTVESPAGMNVFAGQAKPVAPSLGRASQPIRLPADAEPPAANSCSRMTSATAGRSGRSATRGFPETRRADSTIPNDVWDRTIIGLRSPSSWQPCGSSSGSSDPRESRPHPTSPATGNRRVFPATTALRRYNHRPPCASIPPSCACLRSGLSPGAFRSLTAPRRRHGPIVAIGTRDSRRWRIQGRVRRLRLRIRRTGPTNCLSGFSCDRRPPIGSNRSLPESLWGRCTRMEW